MPLYPTAHTGWSLNKWKFKLPKQQKTALVTVEFVKTERVIAEESGEWVGVEGWLRVKPPNLRKDWSVTSSLLWNHCSPWRNSTATVLKIQKSGTGVLYTQLELAMVRSWLTWIIMTRHPISISESEVYMNPNSAIGDSTRQGHG